MRPLTRRLLCPATAAGPSLMAAAMEGARRFEAVRAAAAEREAVQDREGSVARYARSVTGPLPRSEEGAAEGEASASDPPPLLYRDDTRERRRAVAAVRRSVAYRELHGRYTPNSGLGLFGGEPGFDVSPRMHVDPDRPHVRTLFNKDPLLGNLRYARYGHFKKELHLIDLNKLVNHARLLPPPMQLLSDLVMHRVPLPDASCAALMRHAGNTLRDLNTRAARADAMGRAKELFERLLVQHVPPAEVGIATHAEAIRCAAAAADWELGAVFWRRAEREMRRDPKQHAPTADFYDAVLALCVACDRGQDGLDALRQLLALNLRPQRTTLDAAMLLLAHALLGGRAADITMGPSPLVDAVAAPGEHMAAIARAACAGDATAGALPPAATDDATAAAMMRQGEELWTLYELFDCPPAAESVTAYLALLAAAGRLDEALLVVAYAQGRELPIAEEAHLWLLYAMRSRPGAGALALQTVADMRARALSVDARHHQVALMAMAGRGEGEAAHAYLTANVLPAMRLGGHEVAITPEVALYALLALARDASPSAAMVATADALLGHVAELHSALDVRDCLYEAFFLLCGRAEDAAAVAHGSIRRAIADGCTITARMLNHALLAVANSAATGGCGQPLATELLSLFGALPHLRATQQTFAAVDACRDRHGLNAAGEALFDELLAAALETAQQKLPPLPTGDHHDADVLLAAIPSDAPLLTPHVPPHRARSLAVGWRIRQKDVQLSRHGQYRTRPPVEKIRFGSMRGSHTAFGGTDTGIINA